MKAVLITGVALVLAGCTSNTVTMNAPPTMPGTGPASITISCYRGPWRDVIWDRPNAVFTDDLLKSGYSLKEAEIIGNRICKDEYGVDDPAYLVNTLNTILKQQPPG